MSTTSLAVQAKAIELGKLAVRATTAAGTGHPTTALSLAHLVAVLMYRVMRLDPRRPAAPGADRLVLSPNYKRTHLCVRIERGTDETFAIQEISKKADHPGPSV
jgi:transketolase N-terminal domain/subunit